MRRDPNLWTIPPGSRFLPVLTDAIVEGRLIGGIREDGLYLADLTIYVPTRRAARTLRALFVERTDGRATILPTIRPLGEFDDDSEFIDIPGDPWDLPPPVSQYERLLALAPLVRAWKSRLPAHIASLFEEELIVPASAADAIWLARDLAALLDEVETEEGNWAALGELAPAELAGWWQVTLDFLKIVTEYWPRILAERERTDPAVWRSARINAEAERLKADQTAGPVVAAGSTGSIPATARLLSVIAKHPKGAVVLPGLDKELDTGSWALIGRAEAAPSVIGHPQYGLKKLLRAMGADRSDVADLGGADDVIAARSRLVSEALRPAETTDLWQANRGAVTASVAAGALENMALIEAPDERHEALAIAIALRSAVSEPGRRAALVTGDRDLARRVSSELTRFEIEADDSGGRPLIATPAATLVQSIAETVFRPGDPARLLDLLTHPSLRCGRNGTVARNLSSFADLILLRGAAGRPDIADIVKDFDNRLVSLDQHAHAPFWFSRLDESGLADVRQFLVRLNDAVRPLCEMRSRSGIELSHLLVALTGALEALGRDEEDSIEALYSGDAGESLTQILRSLIASEHTIDCRPEEAPDVLNALLSAETVKPSAAGDGRIAVWGVLEARLQSVDTLVIGGLNEGNWPRKAETGRFMSRVLSGGIGLEPPERRTGQAAHDFQMAMGTETVILSRSARAGGAPTTPSRWLQRLLAIIGEQSASTLGGRGGHYLKLAEAIDKVADAPPAKQPCPTPPPETRPRRFSVTEIETLRRDPYAIYARRILRLEPIDPLCRDPGAAERGSLFHRILQRFSSDESALAGSNPEKNLLEIAMACFDEARLPDDVRAVWWLRFVEIALALIRWEVEQSQGVAKTFPEVYARRTEIGTTGVTLSGRADRIDLLDGGARAEILDYKTGSLPTRGQAHTLLVPQLALEGALLAKGAFTELGPVTPVDLKFIRLKPDGTIKPESILRFNRNDKPADAMADEAWAKLQGLIAYYADRNNGYRSRALPLREHDFGGDYDHLARVHEWSAGPDDGEGP